MKGKLSTQKYLRLLRLMSPEQAEEYEARLRRGFVDTRIVKRKGGSVQVYMEKHDSIGNFAIVIEPSGRVRGGVIHRDGSMAEPVKRY